MPDASLVRRPIRFEDAAALADAVLERVGRRLVVGLPLGIGKANRVANALFELAARDQSVKLDIFTALTLERPRGGSELAQRFVEPMAARLYEGYEDLAYAEALRQGGLPPNVEVSEFYFAPGAWLSSNAAQQSYVSANYANAAVVLLERGVNVLAQLVAPSDDGERLSLSSNTDITLDVLPELQRRRASGEPIALVAETNAESPYMPGSAETPANAFDMILDAPDGGFRLFGTPRQPVAPADYAAGLHAASLVPDGGTLQIGIGSLADALVYALILRHRRPETFRALIAALGADPDARETEPFEIGLYGVTEMFVEGFLALHEAGVLSRRVVDDLELTRRAADGDPAAAERIAAEGVVLHGAFFIGSRRFQQTLRDLSPEERALFRMTAVSFTNTLFGEEELKRQQRRDARFVNIAMMATLLGAAVSDALEDGRVVSGVGGQHDFQTQAQALDGARAILMLHATRAKAGKTRSNIVWSYGHETIPRHLRDVLVTEYGVADVGGLGDGDVIEAMLAIADARFQPELLRAARDAGKIAKGWRPPASTRANTPTRIEAALAPFRSEEMFPDFPFGSELTDAEKTLAPALRELGESSRLNAMIGAIRTELLGADADAREADLLARMGVDRATGLQDRLQRGLTLSALRRRSFRGR